MAISKDQKKTVVQELKDAFNTSKSVILIDPTGLTMPETKEIRDTLRNKSIRFRVAKKSLIQIAEKAQNYQFDPEVYTGSIGLAFGYEDELEPAKITTNLAKKFENFKIKGGVFQNQFINLGKVSELAQIPSQEELYAKVTGSVAAPLYGMVNVLSGNLRNLVYLLKNYQEKLT